VDAAGAVVSSTAPLGIYVHVPFCEQKCAYCDFFTLTDPRREHPLFDDWLNLCAAEFRLWRRDFPNLEGRAAGSVFFGGGTPSLLPAEMFGRFLDEIRSGGGLADGAEVSLETQPGTLADADFERFVQAGITRFSIGVQTFNPALLEPTARRHSVEDSERTIRAARASGAIVSLDMICSLPGQTPEQWREDLERAISFSPDHISVYEMTYHAGTDYYRQWKRGRIEQADDAVRAEMFRWTRQRLTSAGYEHYEISNYAKPGFRSRHNQVYWRLQDFVGLGAGAHGYVSGHRYANPRSARDYAKAVRDDRLFAKNHDSTDADITLVENLQMALRLTEGVNMGWLARVLGQDIRLTHAAQLQQLTARGWITFEADHLRLTEEGQLHADSVAEYFLIADETTFESK
jgi:oxygen-independent coproporphyrinogen-3 oxidase